MNTQSPARVPADLLRIDPAQPQQLQYWARELGVTEKQLGCAIAVAGPATADVRRCLGR